MSKKPKCEWTLYGKAKSHKGPFPKCGKPADFVKPTERTGQPWHREHCEGLIMSRGRTRRDS